MEILKTKIEDPQHAYDRVCEQLLEVGERALGHGATKKDINEYNKLHDQRLEHHDGTRGHLHLEREFIVFKADLVGHRVKLALQRPPQKIPYRLKPGTNIVMV